MSSIFDNGGIIGILNIPNTNTASGIWSLSAVLDNISNWPIPFYLTISSNKNDLNLRNYALSNGWNGLVPLIVTINSGVYISSTSSATPALTVSGLFAGGVKLINNGFIIGLGGAGGSGSSGNGGNGAAGGLALSVAANIFIDNQGTIAGGGGGGGGGSRNIVPPGGGSKFTYYYGGAGGGGGRSNLINSSGGSGGVDIQGTGNNGTNGSLSSAGLGGTDGSPSGPANYNDGGNGGNWGSVGSSGIGSDGYSGGSGGAGGAAVSGNSNITWIQTGTRLGAIT